MDGGVLEAEVLAVGHAAHGHQNPVILFFHLLAVELGSDLDLLARGLDLQNLRLQAHLLEGLLGVGRHRSDEVRVGSSQNRFHGLDDGDFGTHRRIHGTEFHADVAATDDQQFFGDVGDFECLGGGHHPGITQIERLREGRAGTGCDDGLVEGDVLLTFGGFHAQLVR